MLLLVYFVALYFSTAVSLDRDDFSFAKKHKWSLVMPYVVFAFTVYYIAGTNDKILLILLVLVLVYSVYGIGTTFMYFKQAKKRK